MRLILIATAVLMLGCITTISTLGAAQAIELSEKDKDGSEESPESTNFITTDLYAHAVIASRPLALPAYVDTYRTQTDNDRSYRPPV